MQLLVPRQSDGTIEAMKAIGVDIIEIERIVTSIDRHGARYLQRVYTPQELAYCNGRPTSLAARWAAKEATAKALGTGIGEVGWQEIEVVNADNGSPALNLHGKAAALAEKLGISDFAISLSHTKEYAVAFVVGD
jgi:holo-[acyl-carrier protein] synthase